jgi:hypothetical protein
MTTVSARTWGATTSANASEAPDIFNPRVLLRCAAGERGEAARTYAAALEHFASQLSARAFDGACKVSTLDCVL